MKTEHDYRLNQVLAIAARIKTTPLSQSMTESSYQQHWIPRSTHCLPVTKFASKQCCKQMSPIYQALLPHLGNNRPPPTLYFLAHTAIVVLPESTSIQNRDYNTYGNTLTTSDNTKVCSYRAFCALSVWPTSVVNNFTSSVTFPLFLLYCNPPHKLVSIHHDWNQLTRQT